MAHTIEVLVELEVDGVAVVGFPLRHRSVVDFLDIFSAEDFGDSGFLAAPVPMSQLQVVFLTSDQDFSTKLNGEPAVTEDILCGGFLLILGSQIDVAPFLTYHTMGPQPGLFYGVVAGAQT